MRGRQVRQVRDLRQVRNLRQVRDLQNRQVRDRLSAKFEIFWNPVKAAVFIREWLTTLGSEAVIMAFLFYIFCSKYIIVGQVA